MKPFNANFFCHEAPVPDAAREAGWRAVLAPYCAELGIDPGVAPIGSGRLPFDARAAAVLAEFESVVVSFHFGLPSGHLLARMRRWGGRSWVQ
mgnify:CR=1 FL=1